MAENSKIQWTDHTFNPWVGCEKVHTGCKFCYAEEMMDHRYHRVKWGPGGTRSKTKTWNDPPRWQREAEASGHRAKVFCASLADIFEKRPELQEWRRELFQLIDKTPSLDYLMLTKRPENVPDMWYSQEQGGFGKTELTRREFRRRNVWIGTSISDQDTADIWGQRLIRHCRPFARFLFLSLEPQIGPVDLDQLLSTGEIDWVIVGGESKQGKGEPRKFDIAWVEQALQSCALFGVPCFVKQFGSRVVWNGEPWHCDDSHGGNWEEWPEQFRVRECPEKRGSLLPA